MAHAASRPTSSARGTSVQLRVPSSLLRGNTRSSLAARPFSSVSRRLFCEATRGALSRHVLSASCPDPTLLRGSLTASHPRQAPPLEPPHSRLARPLLGVSPPSPPIGRADTPPVCLSDRWGVPVVSAVDLAPAPPESSGPKSLLSLVGL